MVGGLTSWLAFDGAGEGKSALKISRTLGGRFASHFSAKLLITVRYRATIGNAVSVSCSIPMAATRYSLAWMVMTGFGF